MKIVNETGLVRDTKVLDDQGNDITVKLGVTKIVIEAGDGFNRATLWCEGVELDVAVPDDQVVKQGA